MHRALPARAGLVWQLPVSSAPQLRLDALGSETQPGDFDLRGYARGVLMRSPTPEQARYFEASVELIPGAGHTPAEEQPDATVDAILRHLLGRVPDEDGASTAGG